MNTKKKFIFSVLSVAIVAVFAVVFALAYTTAKVTSKFNIAFTAEDVDVTVTYTTNTTATKQGTTGSEYWGAAASENTTTKTVNARTQVGAFEIPFITELDTEAGNSTSISGEVNSQNAYATILSVTNNESVAGDTAQSVRVTFSWSETHNSNYTLEFDAIAEDAFNASVVAKTTGNATITKTVTTGTGTITVDLDAQDVIYIRVRFFPSKTTGAQYDTIAEGLTLNFGLTATRTPVTPAQQG